MTRTGRHIASGVAAVVAASVLAAVGAPAGSLPSDGSVGTGLPTGLPGLREASAEPRFGTVTTVQAPRGHSLRTLAFGDVDGDGREDLVLCTRHGGKRPGRTLHVHYRRAGEIAFDAAPDLTYELTPDVTAFGVADVDPDPGGEVVLFAAGGVYAWRPGAPEEDDFVRLLEGAFLWQMPDPKEAFAWEGSFRDVNGDGLTDLLLPQPDSYRVALQRRTGGEGGVAARAEFVPNSVLRVPEDEVGDETEPRGARKMRARAERKRIRIALQFGDGAAAETEDLLAVTETVPAPQVLDFDGDGRADVVAQTATQLCVWRQRPDGTFPADPDGTYTAPVVADRQRRLDVSFSALAGDLDQDRRAVCVVFAGDKRSSTTRTQVLVFRQGSGQPAASPLFGDEGVPQQLLVIGGFGGAPRLIDVDGDGRKDLTCGAVRVDGIDAISAAAKGTIDAELYVYRNLGGTFSKTPVLAQTLSIQGEAFGKAKDVLVARFVPDVSKDGVRDLLLRSEATRLRLLMVRKRGEAFQVLEEPLWETLVGEAARVVVRDGPGGTAEAYIVEEDQVRHVRWP